MRFVDYAGWLRLIGILMVPIMCSAIDNDSKVKFLKDFILVTNNSRFRELRSVFEVARHKELNILFDGSKLLRYNNQKDYGFRDHRIVDLNCADSLKLIETAAEREYFTAPYKWLFLSLDLTSPSNNFDNMSWLLDSEVTLAQAKNEKIILHQLYKYHKRDPELTSEDFGYWTKSERFVKTQTYPVTSYRRKNLHKREIRASVVCNFPTTFEELGTFKNPDQDSLSKQSYAMNLLLMEFANATYVPKPINSWGRLLPNGSWTGIVQQLVERRDDIAGTGMFMNLQRVPYIYFLWRNCKTRVIYIFRRPPLSYVSNIFRLSFQTNVWISSALLGLLLLVVVYITVAWEVRHIKNVDDDAATVPLLQQKWSDVCLFLLGGMCQQGCEVEPRGYSGRIVTLFLFMSLMFLYVSYSANIVALLQATSDNINTLDDLLTSRLQLGYIDLEYARTLRNATDPILMQIYEKKIGPKGFYNISEGIRRIQQGLFGFLGEAGPCYKHVGETFKENEKCDLHEIPLSGNMFVNTYLPISKRSPYIELFKVGFLRLEEHGLQQRSFFRYYEEQPKCANAAANFVMVGLIDSYLAFVLWGCGVGGAIVFLIIEKLYTLQQTHNIMELLRKYLKQYFTKRVSIATS